MAKERDVDRVRGRFEGRIRGGRSPRHVFFGW